MNKKLISLAMLSLLPACSLVDQAGQILSTDGIRFLTDPDGALEHASSEASASLQAELALIKRARELEAIGYQGLADALPLVQDSLDHDDERIRRGAVRGLRADRSEDADAAIATRLQADPSLSVRMAAAEEMAERDRPEAVQARIDAAKRDGAAEVRTALLAGLSPLLRDDPTVRALFERTRTADRDPAIREFAKATLADLADK